MRFYVARGRETLFDLSRRFGIGLDEMMSANPTIDRADAPIQGRSVRIPDLERRSADARVLEPFCPPVPASDFLHNWIPLTSPEKMADIEYDVLIVGSGPGGSAALWRLCEQWGDDGKKIGMVERGPQYLPTHVANIATINGLNFRIYRPPQITALAGNELPQYPALKLIYALGGRSLLWGAITPRMPAHEIDRHWPMSAQEMDPYYNIAEEVMTVTRDYTKDSSMTKVLLKRLRENGYPHADDIPIAADLDQTRLGRIHSNVFFSTISLMARALSHRPFDLAVDAYCTEVVTEGGRAAGIRVATPDGRSYYIRAKTVIMAASAIQTPRILLNSNIPGRAIGRYLTNHTYLVSTATLDTSRFPDPLGVLGIMIPPLPDRLYQLQVQGPGKYFNYHYDIKPNRDEWLITDFYASGRVESRFENRVYIDPGRRDAYGVPEVQISFSYSALDEAIYRQMYQAVIQSASIMRLDLSAAGGGLAICTMPPGADNHESCTCRMGTDPNTSATNPFGQIHDVPGLYVADNSVLPSIGASNPTLSTVALAIRTADHIARAKRE